MSIVWFPGHMAAARKKAAESMAHVDVVIEVLDARAPGASSNPMIEQLRLHRQRPCLKVLNKADLADPAVTAEWLRWFESRPAGKGHQTAVKAVALSCKKPADVARLPRLAASLAPHRDSPLKPARLIVMGIPNVGKSTLINALLKRKVAQTGDEPAITKQQSRHKLTETIELTDTPGLMWPSIEHASDGLMLAASNAIGRNAYIDEEVAAFLAEVLLARYPDALAARYGFPVSGLDGIGVVEAVARRRGFRSRGAAPDLDKAALTLLQDFRTGALGRITLETPSSREDMIAREHVSAPRHGDSSEPSA